MPYSTNYTQTTTYQISNSVNSFSRSSSATYTGSGSERRTINERIPSGMSTFSGINVTFYTGSGAFLAFSVNSASYPLTVSGHAWGYSIDLSSTNNNNCFFFKTGNGGFYNIDNLSIKDVPGTLWVKNTGASERTLIVETLGDASPGWASPVFP